MLTVKRLTILRIIEEGLKVFYVGCLSINVNRN